MKKNNLIKLKIFFPNFLIGSILVLLTLFIYLISANSFIFSYLFEHLINLSSELVYKIIISQIPLMLLFILLIFYFMKRPNRNTISNFNKDIILKIGFFCILFLTIALFYLRGEKIAELKRIGFELKDRIDLYSNVKNEKPESIDAVLLPKDLQSGRINFKNNFSYNKNDGRLFINPDFLYVTIYYYNTTTKNFEELD